LADAQAAAGRGADALISARRAWASADLPANDEVQILARYGANLVASDHDRRIDALLFAKRPTDAARLAYLATPARKAGFNARIALQSGDSAAETVYAAAAPTVTADAGLMMDRARYLRDRRDELSARALFARAHQFSTVPADAERFTEMMLILARGAAADGRWQQAYDIAHQTDDVLAPGIDPRDQPYAVRDNLTSLDWLAGTTAIGPLGRPAAAVASFDSYSKAGRSLQVAAKGQYWASQAAARAGRAAEARAYLERTAASPDQFYGQLALERLGRAMPVPAALPGFSVSDGDRAAFARSPVVMAYRRILQVGTRSEQALFVRSLAESLDDHKSRIMASELGSATGRIDLPVWVARAARNAGDSFYYRSAFPTLSYAPSGGRIWSLTHGISRQESSFDPSVVSHANAYGLMQIVPSTGAEQAGKMGVAFASSRLVTDPAFNVMLGSAYFQRLLDRWGGSYPLAVASYNAGAGNVNKWVRNYGDPRTPGVDMLGWIEKIPFEETKGYVQRVLENSVVYDTMNPSTPAGQRQLTYYLNRGAVSG
jgi:soluble lytic murein transglycosylase